MRKIHKIESAKIKLPIKKRVGAYARISIEKGRTLNSLSAQVNHYSNFIQAHPGWEYIGVYADSGETGTSAGRDEFQRLIADCEAGKIDIVLTKSISRFARNTVDLLKTVRRLKEIGVEVRFEREGINSSTANGELMLSILASFAQEESRQISENLKWSIRNGFKDGKPHRLNMYGYRYKDGECVIIPEEAEVVKRIFNIYLEGLTPVEIAEQLNRDGIKNYSSLEFKPSNIAKMLKNERYIGTLLLQKTYVEEHINKKGKTNKGEFPMYLIEDAHPAIIDKDIFQAVQDERLRRMELGVFANKGINTSVLTGKIKCGTCGCSFHRKISRNATKTKSIYWQCFTKAKEGAALCPVGNIPEDKLKKAAAEILGIDEFDDIVFTERIARITIPEQFTIIFLLNDGTIMAKQWRFASKRDEWTLERRQAQSERLKLIFAFRRQTKEGAN